LDTNQFWAIIEAGGPEVQDDPERQLAAVRQALLAPPPDELIEFHRLFNRAMEDAYTWDLWGAAYLINGGGSDDGFAYFRSWLISRGRGADPPAAEGFGGREPAGRRWDFDDALDRARGHVATRTTGAVPAVAASPTQ